MQHTRLKWVAVVAPVVFLAVLEAIRVQASTILSPIGVYLALGAVVVAGVYLFAHWIFGRMATLEREIRRQNHELGVLNQVSTLLNRSTDLDTCLTRALDAAMTATGCEVAELFLREDRTGDMVRHLHRGPCAELFAERARFPTGQGFPGLVAAQGETMVVNDLAADQRFLRPQVQAAGFRCFASIPLKFRDKVVGALNVATRGHRLDADGVHLLEAIAGQLGMRIENASLHERVVETKDYLSRLIEGSGDAIITTDLNARVLSWNRGATEIYGYAAEEVLGKPFHMTPPHLAAEAQSAMERLRQGETVRNLETQRIHKSGRLIDVVVTAAPLRDAAGRVIGFSGISKDVTELKRLQLDLALHQERDRICRDLHDGVIQSIYATGLTLEATANGLNPDLEPVRQRLYQTIDQLTGIIKDIRNYIFDLRPNCFANDDPEEVLVEMLEVLRVNTLMETTLQVAPGLLEQLGASQRIHLQHLVRECLANVSRHAGATEVQVQIEPVPGGLSLRVADNGRGFDPNGIAEPGQGLRNMAARAEDMGGKLALHSAPGQGTRVEVFIPLAGAMANDEQGGQ